MASVGPSRLTAEDVVTIGILCRAAKGALLRKAHLEAEAPPKKSLPFGRGPPLRRELRGRACEPMPGMGAREKLSNLLVARTERFF